MAESAQPWLEPIEGGVQLAVRVVPGGSRDQVVGPRGDALKVKVSAPAEGGKANKAVWALLAETLGVSRRNVSVEAGRGTPRKRIAVRGIDPATAAARLDG
jgi:uncharacterized protein (TIGR00251 family)